MLIFSYQNKIIYNNKNNSNDTTNHNERSKSLIVPKTPSRGKSPNTKQKFQKISKKLVKGTKSLPLSSSNEDNDGNESEQDEEEIGITWAHSVLIKEFSRRCDLRNKTKETKARVNEKLVAFQQFKKLQEEQRKKEAKKEAKGETIYKKIEENNTEIDTNAKIVTDININDIKSDTNLSHSKTTNKNNAAQKNEEINNQKFEVVSLKDQIRKEKDRAKMSMVSSIYSNEDRNYSETEKEKIKEAKKVLKRLDKVAELKKQQEREEQERIKEERRKEIEKTRLKELRSILHVRFEDADAENVETDGADICPSNDEAGKS